MYSIDPVAFSAFGLSVRWYGIMIALGVLFATVIACAREQKLGLKKDSAVNLILIALPVAIICARLYYVAFSWDMYRDNLWEIFHLRGGGLALYGGLIGGVLAGVLYARASRISVGRLADLAAPAIAIGQAFGRWGNFFNQEAYGAAIADPALRFFPIGVYIQAEAGWFYATFFYESLWCLLLCGALLLAERRGGFRRSGDTLLWYGFGYALERVAVEALRTDSLYWGPVRVSQLVSALLLAGITVWFALRLRSRLHLLACAPAVALCAIALTGQSVRFGWLALLSLLQLVCTLRIYRNTKAQMADAAV
ncbi:MAG: prolipoprotein diacylglyceryl transferase [Clostridia bacterium]|nr:prolipoprotein diacylglyceryl transferase [Clostridia bacterium]